MIVMMNRNFLVAVVRRVSQLRVKIIHEMFGPNVLKHGLTADTVKLLGHSSNLPDQPNRSNKVG